MVLFLVLLGLLKLVVIISIEGLSLASVNEVETYSLCKYIYFLICNWECLSRDVYIFVII